MSLAGNEAAVEASNDSFQTFDNFEEIAEEAESASDDDWSKPVKEEEPEQKASEDLKVLDDSQADSEGKVIKEDKEEKKEKKEEKEEEEEEEVEAKEEEDDKPEESKEEDKKESKKLRMRMGDDLYNVDANASFKVKVDGEMTDVPLQELINNYSGKTAWDKKFTELGKDKKTLEFEKKTLTQQKEVLQSHLKQALEPLKNPEKNPLDSLLYLVEMSGEDPYNAYRRIMEANLEELGSLLDMSETERELYFHKKKDELYGNVARKRQEKMQKEEAFNQALKKVDSLRQSFKVTEDQFVDASEELEEIYKGAGLDINDITEEAIVDYASLKPHIEVVKQLIEPYEDNISEGKYGDVVAELSRYLRDGKADKATIEQLLKRNYSVEEEVKELNTKLYQKAKAKSPSKKIENKSQEYETFDDWN